MYYFERLFNSTFLPYTYFLPISIIMGLISRNRKIKLATLYITICSFTYLLLISYPHSKFQWYDAPVYPFISLLIGIFFYCIYDYSSAFFDRESKVYKLVFIILLVSIFIIPYIKIYNKIERYSERFNYSYIESNFVKKIHLNGTAFNYKVYYHPYIFINAFQLNFYRKAYSNNDGIKINVYDSISQVKINDTVMVCQQEKKDTLNKYFDTQTIDRWDKCLLVVIKKQRNFKP